MFKKKITKLSLDELAKVMPVIEEWEMRTMVGGTGGYLPPTGNEITGNYYTWEEFELMSRNGEWRGGYVGDSGICTYFEAGIVWLNDSEITAYKNYNHDSSRDMGGSWTTMYEGGYKVGYRNGTIATLPYWITQIGFSLSGSEDGKPNIDLYYYIQGYHRGVSDKKSGYANFY